MRTNDITDKFLTAPPFTEQLVFERRADGVYTNVPHLVTHHSPTGYEFGFAGSGPADLALNICENVLRRIGHQGPRTKCWDGNCFQAAFAMHQEFKFGWIAPLPRQGWELPFADVRAWIEGWLARNAVQDAALAYAVPWE